MMENRVSGKYKTERDGGLQYSYVATWETTAGGVTWTATVRRDGALTGTPLGTVFARHVEGIGYARFIEALVVASIEQQTGVD